MPRAGRTYRAGPVPERTSPNTATGDPRPPAPSRLIRRPIRSSRWHAIRAVAHAATSQTSHGSRVLRVCVAPPTRCNARVAALPTSPVERHSGRNATRLQPGNGRRGDVAPIERKPLGDYHEFAWWSGKSRQWGPDDGWRAWFGGGVADALVTVINEHVNEIGRRGGRPAAIGCVPWLTSNAIAIALGRLSACCVVVSKNRATASVRRRVVCDGLPNVLPNLARSSRMRRRH